MITFIGVHGSLFFPRIFRQPCVTGLENMTCKEQMRKRYTSKVIVRAVQTYQSSDELINEVFPLLSILGQEVEHWL